jgi:hypothetical protein
MWGIDVNDSALSARTHLKAPFGALVRCTHHSGHQHEKQLMVVRTGEATAFSFLHRAFILLLARLA